MPGVTTRQRMIASAALLIRERGARATSIDAVLEHSGAPRGSVYHHFPGGRDELLTEATRFAGAFVGRRLERGEGENADPLRAFDAFVSGYLEDLVASEMRSGCPVAAVAIESRADGSPLQREAGAVFERWQHQLASNFASAGIAPRRAGELAVLAISAIEGALILSRGQDDAAPLQSVRRQLLALLRAELKDHHQQTNARREPQPKERRRAR